VSKHCVSDFARALMARLYRGRVDWSFMVQFNRFLFVRADESRDGSIYGGESRPTFLATGQPDGSE
jgi:hypothetical protein